ncbi:hypothetical protein [Sedimenticola sp.]|uniref:hypothetical protein n=1 Tax=Sedimenticola sp. TaxID=1940285 RepID=UPI003D09DAB6
MSYRRGDGLAASVIAGLAWDRFGSQATFLLGCGFALLSALVVAFAWSRHKL